MAFEFDRCFVAVAGLLTVVLCSASPVTAQDWPPAPKNLQFFPEDIEPGELIRTMRGFSFSLGVRCQHCHVGEEGQPIFSFDFSSDEKETKRTARLMLEMVEAINGEHLARLDGDAGASIRVRCVTCHRGVAQPRQLEDILVDLSQTKGAEAAVTEYRELRQEYYGSGAYNFSESSLMKAAEALAGSEKTEEAVALIEETLVYTPESRWALGTLAEIELQRGDTGAAIAALERILAFDRENTRVRKQLEMLVSQPVEGSEDSSE